MRRDYYTFWQAELSSILNSLEQEAEAFEEAKRQGDRNAGSQAEKQMQKAAEKAVKMDPHLAYLWLEAKKVGAEKEQQESEKAIYANAANALQDEWQEMLTTAESPWDRQRHDFAQVPEEFKFVPTEVDVAYLPAFSFVLVMPFRLKKPYLSKDDRDFYLMDNPLRREKVFRTPMVASSQWKGTLRSAMVRELITWWQGLNDSQRKPEEFARRRFRLALLFGDEKGEEPDSLKGLAKYLDEVGGDEAAKAYRRKVREYFGIEEDKPMPNFQGRLHFYPTFFEEIGREVINPHDRKTGVGARGPILMECVPTGSNGVFTLLYVPFGPYAVDGRKVREEAGDAMQAVAYGVQAMFTKYGFGAKTSSGFGTVKEKLPEKGVLVLNAQLDVPAPREEESIPKYLESRARLKPEYLREDGSLKTWEEYEGWMRSQGQTVGKRSKKRYDEAKKWYEEELPKILGEAEAGITKVKFDSISELAQRAGEIAEQLRRGGKDE